MNDCRFGIRVGELRSHCWRVRSGANRPELFIEREGMENAVHVSLHESGIWHAKVQGRAVRTWQRPSESHPGLTRAVIIVQPCGIANLSVPAHERAVLSDVASGGDAAQFNVFIEEPGADESTWPGARSMGTEFVGRLPLAEDAGFCCIVLHRAALELGSLTLPRPVDESVVENMRDLASKGQLGATLFGEHEGALVLTDVRAAATVQPS